MTFPTRLSCRATSDGHGENSPYFDGWKEYETNPYHPQNNPSGIIQMGLAENQVPISLECTLTRLANLCSFMAFRIVSNNGNGFISCVLQLSFDLIESWLKEHPESSICTPEGISSFKEIANYQDYHGLPAFREGIALFMEEVGGRKAKFEKERIVLTAGATAAHEVLTFCLADPGEAFLVPSPYYPGFDRDLRWRTGAEVIPVECKSCNNFNVTVKAVEEAYREAEIRKIRVKGVLITNPSNPLGTTMDSQTLRELVCFTREKKIHLICDEIYAGSVFSGPRFVSVAEIVAKEENVEHVHIIYSLSKDMGLPGFRVGVIYSYNDAVVTAARRMSSFSMVSSQTQHMLGGMLRDRAFVRKYIEENKRRLGERQREFVSGLREAGIEVLAGSNAGLFCWVDLRHLLHSQKTELRLWNSIVKEIGLNV
ncbi:hypothetical protein KI387_031716, partial [Taxus chinensis]